MASDTGDSCWVPLRSEDDGQLLVAIYPALRRFAGVVSASDGDPDDLLQSAVEKLLQSRIKIDNPGAYLRRTMVNLESNRRRGLGRFRTAMGRLRPGEHHEVYPSDLSLLEVLSATDRSIVFLLDVEGWPSRTVAEELGLSDAAVRSRATRARDRLRTHLEGEDA